MLVFWQHVILSLTFTMLLQLPNTLLQTLFICEVAEESDECFRNMSCWGRTKRDTEVMDEQVINSYLNQLGSMSLNSMQTTRLAWM